MRFVFFSMNDFRNEGGGTIRMLGILNELAERGNEVVLISNTLKNDSFNQKIKHISIDHTFSRKNKRFFQGLMGIFPYWITNIFYKGFLEKLKIYSLEKYSNENIYFFEYLDNSIGYWLFKNNVIKGYINDLHGVATLEFKFQSKLAKTTSDSIKFYFKYLVSNLLDRKVFNNAEGLIFASKTMKSFFEELYPLVTKKKNYILPYVLNSKSCLDIVDNNLKQTLIKGFEINDDQKVIFFAGSFKKTGGVPDLIEAFNRIIPEHKNIMLLLIGDGPTMEECIHLVSNYNLQEKIIFVGRIPYDELRTYQDLADVIVCPDKQNMYSELIIHVKYLDALVSGKIVVNGSFKSVLEINKNESLSINFIPSNTVSLSDALNRSLFNLEKLNEKYSSNKSFVCEKLTYKSFVEILENK